jgi:hypothetical protein
LQHFQLCCVGLSLGIFAFSILWKSVKYDKQDQQGKAAFNERNPHMTLQQEPMARSSGGKLSVDSNVCCLFHFTPFPNSISVL